MKAVDHSSPTRDGIRGGTQRPGNRGARIAVFMVVLVAAAYGVWQAALQDVALRERLALLRLPTNLAVGVAAVLLVAAAVVGYLGKRRQPSFLPVPRSSHEDGIATREERMRGQARWFIHMRWVAAVASLNVILIALYVARVLPASALPPLLLWWSLLVVANAWFQYRASRARNVEQDIVLQAALDLVVLTGWLNASGGIENPFYYLYLLHVVIAGVLLPKRRALLVAAIACALFSTLALSEYLGLFPHVTIEIFPHSHDPAIPEAVQRASHASYDPVFVAGRVLPFLAVVALLSYLTTMIADRLREGEERLEAAARTEALERRRLEGVIHTANLGVILFDPDQTVRWYGGRVPEWLGLDPSSIGEKCTDADRRGCCYLVKETVRTGRAMEAEYAVEAPDGKKRHFRHATWPIKDSRDRVHQVVKLLEDVTTRKALESRAIHSGHLSALGKMAATVAHEVGNPLASLSGRLALMERSEDIGFLHQSVGLLREQIVRIGRIVHSISSLSRAPSGERTRWEVNAAVEDAVGVVMLDPRAANVEFEIDPHPSPLEVIADRDHIQQAYLNLIINAVEAMPDGGRVSVEVIGQDSEVGVRVRDTGRGIERDVRQYLFEPFVSTKPEGTGIGLAISHSFVVAHGGRIEVESTPGEGSAFTLFLPLAGADVLAPAAAESTGP